jgi:acetyl esterase
MTANGRGGNKVSIVGKTYIESRKPVVVLAQWKGKGPRNVLIERADGSKVVRPFRGLRKSIQ